MHRLLFTIKSTINIPCSSCLEQTTATATASATTTTATTSKKNKRYPPVTYNLHKKLLRLRWYICAELWYFEMPPKIITPIEINQIKPRKKKKKTDKSKTKINVIFFIQFAKLFFMKRKTNVKRKNGKKSKKWYDYAKPYDFRPNRKKIPNNQQNWLCHETMLTDQVHKLNWIHIWM